MDKTAELLFEYLKNILYYPARAELDVSLLPVEFQKLGQGMQFLAACVKEEREFTNALAKGDLSLEPPGADNVLASPAKALQAALRHLQWQTQQVTKGDYTQRVDFMGEFSQAFNTMTAQLSQRTQELIAEKNLVDEKNLDLKRNLDLMLALTNYTHNMIFVFSVKDGRQVFINQTAEWFSMANSVETALLQEKLRACCVEEAEGSLNWETELDLTSGKEKIYYRVESFFISWDEEPAVVHIVIDDTERKKQENLIYSLAYIDPLTGLNNRRYALNLMEHWMQEGTPFLLSFIDVDYLKYCNDTFGHENGDRYLIDTASILLTMHCELCRIGGDEFFLLSTGTDVNVQDEQLSHLRELFSSQMDTPYPKSFSFATIAVPVSPEEPLTEYIKMADEKMHQYKSENKKALSDVLYKDDRI